MDVVLPLKGRLREGRRTSPTSELEGAEDQQVRVTIRAPKCRCLPGLRCINMSHAASLIATHPTGTIRGVSGGVEASGLEFRRPAVSSASGSRRLTVSALITRQYNSKRLKMLRKGGICSGDPDDFVLEPIGHFCSVSVNTRFTGNREKGKRDIVKGMTPERRET
ncbi:hypothetical protein CAPTEDRAFT_201042 [Capitella teleta]|uniref:Uncharacterized protein n=1 Tax=Capitella teleta TaxID=283909 RepID=R7TAM6_CAPTE|nr:hypothetical protein CAPTEDRAFT_201042 [Capitella teleta]|eukprot:ELT90778.1 hypothetical protein CAPTEDRAFT_201042 [Capitella teleta]